MVGKLATEHAVAHPYQTAFTSLSVGLALFLGAGWLTAPVLKAIGFGSLGPVAGEHKLFSQSEDEY